MMKNPIALCVTAGFFVVVSFSCALAQSVTSPAPSALGVSPSGSTGAVQAQTPDSTTAGGNARGANAVDLQTKRGGASQVASGAEAAILYGEGNTSSGQDTVAGGLNSAASGFYGGTFGHNNTSSGTNSSWAFGEASVADGSFAWARGNNAGARGRIGADCFSSQAFAVNADSQICNHVLHGTGASAAAIRLTTDGGAASTNNCVNIPNNAGYSVIATIIAYDHTTVTKNADWLNWGALLTRGANAAATTIVAQATPTPLTNGTLSGQAIAMTADTTNGCLNISYTPPTGNTDTFNVVAHVQTVEVQ